MLAVELEDVDYDEIECVECDEIPEEVLVRNYVINFFASRQMYCGGAIPLRLLCSERNITMVRTTELEPGIRKAYSGIEMAGHIATETDNESLVADDIKIVVAIMRACAIEKVPPKYIPGIVLLYLEFCEGIEFAF